MSVVFFVLGMAGAAPAVGQVSMPCQMYTDARPRRAEAPGRWLLDTA